MLIYLTFRFHQEDKLYVDLDIRNGRSGNCDDLYPDGIASNADFVLTAHGISHLANSPPDIFATGLRSLLFGIDQGVLGVSPNALGICCHADAFSRPSASSPIRKT